MTIQASAWALDQQIPGKAKLVLLALANHADHTNGFVHFAAEVIAHEATIAVSSLWRYLGALERNGYLAKDQRKTQDGDKREYWLALDRDPAVPWAWEGHESDAAADTDPPPEPAIKPIQGSAPAGFDKSKQASTRQVNADEARKPGDPFPVIEGSKAFDAWMKYCQEHRKLAPFLRTMTVNGKLVRGFPMPSLFPPREGESAA